MEGGDFKWHGRRPILPAPYLVAMPFSHTTIAEAFQSKGYKTISVGKWHLGDKGSWPTEHGFDINIGGVRGGGPGKGGYFSPYGIETLEDGPEGEKEMNATLDALLNDTDALLPFENPRQPQRPLENW